MRPLLIGISGRELRSTVCEPRRECLVGHLCAGLPACLVLDFPDAGKAECEPSLLEIVRQVGQGLPCRARWKTAQIIRANVKVFREVRRCPDQSLDDNREMTWTF